MAIVAYKRSWGDISQGMPDFYKERKKKQKRKKAAEGKACGNCRSHEIDKGGLRQCLLDDFTAAWKSLRNKTLGFPTVPPGSGDGHQILFIFSEAAIHLKHAVSWS